ncbi:MAG: hypothetical protein CMJ75_00810 [Planctomycetaceae bacterium]|nr:hypothetical protein [Planctomycetaceae bacterium]
MSNSENPTPADDAPILPENSQKPQREAEQNTDLASDGFGEAAVREQLKNVIDPELFVNIVDLGLIYVVDLEPVEGEKFDVKIEMTMTSPMCPAGPQLIAQSKTFVSAMEEVNDVEVKVVMEPPWTPEKMTDDARDTLGIF